MKISFSIDFVDIAACVNAARLKSYKIDRRNEGVGFFMQNSGFGFGIETEFLMVRKDSFVPLGHKDLNFEFLSRLINSIDTSEFSERGFNIKPLHSKPTPYLVEGYYLTDTNMNPVSLLPKGIEIRTPMTDTIDEQLVSLQKLFDLLRRRVLKEGFDLAVISHHPTESKFNAAPNYKRHDYWQWALTAATTFGPDINISLPEELSKRIDISELAAKINFFMPAAVALTLASPLTEGGLWKWRGQIGKSIRTYRRSIWAPLFYVHEKPSLRFEFKGFEMSRCIEDYNAFFLLSLAILLDDELKDQATDETRIYDLGNIALDGLNSRHVCETAARVLEAAEHTARKLGLSRECLDEFWSRLRSRRLPADDLIDLFQKEKNIEKTLSHLIGLYSAKEDLVLSKSVTEVG